MELLPLKLLLLLLVPLILPPKVQGYDMHSRIIYLKGSETDREVTIQPANVGETYSNRTTIKAEFHYIYRFRMLGDPPRTSARLRTEVERGRVTLDHPLRITVRVGKGTMNWHLPFESGGRKYYYMERTLCLLHEDKEEQEDDQEIAVIVSTSSKQPVDFRVLLYEVSDFSAALNRQDSVRDVAVPSPNYKLVNLAQARMDSLLQVKVTSDDPSCAIVSVQPLNCPVSDTPETVRAEGAYQTMLSIASFTIERARYGNDDGVFIVFVMPEDDGACGVKDMKELAQGGPINRTKSFSFVITDQISSTRIAWEVGVSTGILIIVSVLTIIATCVYSAHGNSKEVKTRVEKISQAAAEAAAASSVVSATDVEGQSYLETDDADGSAGPGTKMMMTSTTTQESGGGDSPKRLPKYVNELATKGLDREQQQQFKTMFQKSDLYIWLVLMMGIFYGIPAVQLVMSYQEKLLLSGNQDICYYNFLCSIPTGSVADFNHIYSNIWYLGFGVLFVLLTWYRKRQHLQFLDRWEAAASPKHVVDEYGLPHHFGIFYAMGYAMIFEGILSACYHVCPTHENYQFDTTFMYVIATLCFIKIYQFRHPDITSNAYKVFFGLGLVMFLEVLGIFYETVVFWTLVLIAYLLLCLTLTSILYHSGQWSLDFFVFCRIYQSLAGIARTKRFTTENFSKKRLVLVLVINVVNIIFVILGAVYQPGISTFLLCIFISNLLVYSSYYIVMKFYHKERLTLSAKMYFLLAFVCWVPAFYFYANADYSTEVSPSQSRNLNQECLVFDVFDHHDIWHMLSAAGLFFCFMLVQTLDDGLFYVPRNKIHIF